MMKKEYFVGIDFGHGETTVSRVPGYNGELVSQIPLTAGHTAVHKKVISAICRRGEKWSLVLGKSDFPNSDLHEGFKGKIHKLDTKDKNALRIFAKLIFETILNRDDKLKYNSFHDRNFELGIACPTEWRSSGAIGYANASEEYLDFFRRDCNLPVDYCINESDAAFFSKYNEDASESVFVIDYGSSTIDFTTFVNSKVDKKLCWGPNEGAHKIEDILKQHIIDGDNKTRLEEIIQMREKANYKGKIDPAILLFIRKAKEDYYIDRGYERSGFSLNITKRDFIPTMLVPDPCIFAAYYPNEYEDLISSYVTTVENTIIQAKQRLINNHINPTRVILSGGASEMPFFINIVQDTFAESVIDKDTQPECVVSNGIALYGKRMDEALKKFLEELEKIDYEYIFKKEYANAKSKAIKELVSNVTTRIKSYNGCSGKRIREDFFDFLKNLDHNNYRYCHLVTTTINSKLSLKVAEAISNAILEAFKFKISINNINIDTRPAIYHYLPECFVPGGGWYYDITKWIEESSSTLLPSLFFDWDEIKSSYEASKIAEGVASRMKNYDPYPCETFNGLDNSVKDLKTQTIELGKAIFYANQVFETTFKN